MNQPTGKPGASPNGSPQLYSICEYPGPGSPQLDLSPAYHPLHDSLIYNWSTSSEDQEASSSPQLGLPMYEEPPPDYNAALNDKQPPYLGSLRKESFVTVFHESHQQLQQQTSFNISGTTPIRQTSVVVQTAPLIESYRSNIALACCTFWLCGFLFGSVAFFLAVAAEKRKRKDGRIARRLGCASLAFSIVGIIVGNGVAMAIGIAIGVVTNQNSSSITNDSQTANSPFS